jgi:ubiquinone/menaquinone biosynthesis C-methylase UbiE
VNDFSVTLCKRIMQMAECSPDPFDPHLWEVFKTEHYVDGTETHKREVRKRSAIASYNYEQSGQDSWLVKYFFPRLSPIDLKDAILLDLGCFTGGRLVAWVEQYSIKTGLGIDINPVFKVAAEEFADLRGIKNVEFFTGRGESLPFDNDTIDFIVSTDVFEHVQDLEKVLSECHRVLKPGGKLCVVFPQFRQPLEAHLGCVTKMPALHWLFSGEVITRAYAEIINARKDSDWYFPESYPLQSWERLPSLNGTSFQEFSRLISQMKWSSKSQLTRPILSDGRASKRLHFRLLRLILWPLAFLPFTREFFLGRVNFILQK